MALARAGRSSAEALCDVGSISGDWDRGATLDFSGQNGRHCERTGPAWSVAHFPRTPWLQL